MTKRKRGTTKQPATPAARPSGVRLGGLPWARIGVVMLLGVAAATLVGVWPLYDPWPIRGVMCGLVVGLAVRELHDTPWALAAAALAGVAAVPVVTAVQTATEASGPTAAAVAITTVTALVAATVTGSLSALGRSRAAAAVAIAVVIGIQLFQCGVLAGLPREMTAEMRGRLAVEAPAEGYQFDGDLFAKVDHLMASGVPYYAAFLQAYDEDIRMQGSPPGLFNVRQRWIFELWSVLPGPPGTRIMYGFQVLMVATMFAGYGLARRFVEPAAALVAPIALGGYLLFPAITMWITLSEFWAGCVAVLFLWAMVNERWSLGAWLLLASFAFRELMLFLVPVYVTWWALDRRRREAVSGLAVVLLGPVALLSLHALWSPVAGQSAQGVAHWLQGGWDKLLAVLKFSGGTVRASVWAYLAVPVVAVAGAAFTRRAWTRGLLATAVIVPTLALTVFSGGLWNDYWGAIAMPLMLALVPLAAGPLLPSRQALLDERPGARPAHGTYQVLPGRAKPPAGFEEAARAAWAAGADIVVASRLARGARIQGTLSARVLAFAGARAVSSLVRWLCPVPGLRDVTGAVVLVDSATLKAMPPEVRAAATADGVASAHVLAWARENARVAEVPVDAPPATRLPWPLLPALVVERLRGLVTVG